MKKFLFLLVGLLFAAVLSGCNSTIIKEFDKDTGKQIRETQTNLTDLTAFTKNLENKSVFLWRSGWVAYIEGAPASQQNLSAHGVAWCGNVDEGWFFVCKDQQNVKDIASVVLATRSNLAVDSPIAGSISSATPSTVSATSTLPVSSSPSIPAATTK